MRSDKLSQELVEAVQGYVGQELDCIPSSYIKDECMCRVGRGVWQSARAVYRFETCSKYWSWFRADYPAAASKTAFSGALLGETNF